MKKFKVGVYYLGHIIEEVEADGGYQARVIAVENVARLHNKREGDFNEKLLPSLNRAPAFDTVQEVK